MADDAGSAVAGRIDVDRVQAKLDFVAREAASAAAAAVGLRRLASTAAPDSEWADTLLRGVKYGLQAAIQAMIDIAYHLAAKACGSAPGDAYEAFEVLVRHGVIPRARMPRYRSMLGFRNRLVHGYQDVDGEDVLRFAEETSDFDHFRAEVQAFIRTRRDAPGPGPAP